MVGQGNGAKKVCIAHSASAHQRTQVGDHLVHAPSTDSGLSSNVGDYYYAYGATPGSCKLVLGRN